MSTDLFPVLAVSVLLTAPRDIYHYVQDIIVWLLFSYIHEITDNLLIHVVQLNATVWRNSEKWFGNDPIKHSN